MKWDKIKDTVGKFAPLAGGLLGGPAGAAVGGMISKALGVDESPEAVSIALLDPSKAADLRRWEMENEVELQRIQLQTLQVELADTQNARLHNKHSKMPAIICIVLTIMVGLLGWALFYSAIPDKNNEIAYMLFGTVLSQWGASIAYWVGTTRSSFTKTAMMAGKQH